MKKGQWAIRREVLDKHNHLDYPQCGCKNYIPVQEVQPPADSGAAQQDTKRLDWLLYETNTPLSKVRIAQRVIGGDTLLCTREAIDIAMESQTT